APVRMTTSTSGSASARRTASGSSRRTSADRALRASGRLRVTVAMRSATSYSTTSDTRVEPRAGAATFAPVDAPSERRLRRLPEGPAGDLVLHEVDRALRPVVHERRVPSGGAVLDPRTDPTTWGPATDLHIAHTVIGDQPLDAARRFADGMSSWLLRRSDGPDEWLVFDRPAGSERDLGVLAQAFGAVVVQRHPTGAVRVAGPFGVLRWDGFTWHLEPP